MAGRDGLHGEAGDARAAAPGGSSASASLPFAKLSEVSSSGSSVFQGLSGVSAAPSQVTLVDLEVDHSAGGRSPPPEQLPPPPRPPGYEIIGPLGRGGMGVVYKARQVALNRVVALKTLLVSTADDPREVSRLKAEAEAVARVSHRGVVAVYDVGECDGRPYVALEFVPGGTLDSLIRRDGPMDVRKAAEMAAELADAMQAVHERGIVHRDLKPANVLLTETGEPKVTDFGLVRFLHGGNRASTVDVIKGTPAYMSPEQTTGDPTKVGPASDVYAVGAVLFEMLVGRPPFGGEESMVNTMIAVAREPPPRPRSVRPMVPADLEAVCLKCLEKQPADRYPSAAALAADLRRFLAGQKVVAGPPSGRVYGEDRPRPWSAVGVAVAAALLTVGAGVGVWTWTSAPPSPRTPGPPAAASRYTDADIRRTAESLRAELLGKLAGRYTKDGWFLRSFRSDPDGPEERDIWSHAQAAAAVMSAPGGDAATRFAEALATPFAPGRTVEAGGAKWGWPAHRHEERFHGAPAIYLLQALSEAHRRLPAGDPRRAEIVGRLGYVREVLRNHRPPEAAAGWTFMARQTDPSRDNNHATAQAVTALLALRRSGADWGGGADERPDALIAAACRRLAANYDAESRPPGWRCMNSMPERVADGLTLQIYAVLLAAESEAGVPFPEAMVPAVSAHLLSLSGRDAAFPTSPHRGLVTVRDLAGKELPHESLTEFLWHPWAVECCVRWMERLRGRGATEPELAPFRDVLGRLVVELGPEFVREAVKGWVFLAADTLMGLSAVPTARP